MNHKQQLFANAYLRLNDPLVAYIQAYNPKDASNYRSIKSAANRLLRNPEIAEHIRSVRDAVRATAEYELKEQMKEELLSIHDKRLYIKRVINGEILIPQDYKANGCNRCTMFLRPTFPQILGYLKEDSRLAGHYPDQRMTTTTDKKLLTASLRNLSRNRREGERGSLAQNTPPQEQQSATNCPPLPVPHNAGAGVSAMADGGGTLAQDPREEQQTTTIEPGELVIEKDIYKETTNTCPPLPVPQNAGAGVSHSDGGGILAPDFPEEQNRQQNTTTTNSRLLPEELVAIIEKDMETTTNNISPESIPISARGPGKKTLTASPLQGDRGTLAQDTHEKQHQQQLSAAPSLSPLKETSIRQQMTTAEHRKLVAVADTG